ncbi:MAG: phosphate ABC transporter permease PstA [Ilumatobacter sp.]|uniref:phosphate ABC transporter permease PstA n=1 Tax=Ilumatobacter sp. TaxID=1967498 RepID=UPI002623793C|nr:phosphate ABC transporter permease PstA [Ilumatobacter sp.]MDJ0771222.1 phosphate ABC transporter permease PstA [Ilumatobacter sp.]
MPLTTPSNVGAATARSVTGGLTKRGLDVRSKIIEVALIAMLALSLLVLLTLIVDLLFRSWSVWTDRPGDFLSTNLNSQSAADAGIGQAIRGTVILCLVVTVVAFPLGIACAVYLEEYAGRSWFARITRVNVRNLAGVPSIVYGLLGLAIFVRALSGMNGGRNVFAGGLALSALVLPIVVITTSEALRAVPRSIREGALGVGATQWETIRSHVLPSAAPGILTGTVLSLARAAGEAAPVLLVGAATGLLRTGDQSLWEQVQGPFTALPVAIFSYARQPGDDFRSLTAAASIVLLVAVLFMNGVAIWLRNRYEKKW